MRICVSCGRPARRLRNKRQPKWRRCSCGARRTTGDGVVQYGLWLKVTREIVAEMRDGKLDFIGFTADNMARSLARAVTRAGCAITEEVDVQVMLKESIGPVADPFNCATIGVKCRAQWTTIHDRGLQEVIVRDALNHVVNRKMQELFGS